MKTLSSSALIVSALLAVASSTVLATEPDAAAAEGATKEVDAKCQAPKWAIAIGHEEKWKLHNGCTEAKPADADAGPDSQKKPEAAQ